MKKQERERLRFQSQNLMWDAMDALNSGNESKAKSLCEEALGVYPDCVDALSMLAEIKPSHTATFVAEMRNVIEAGRRDLGAKCFKEDTGYFWGLIETRPFMRAMAQLAFALIEWGVPERVDEAIAIFEEMLELNPNDNQGVRDWLAGCYLARKRYNDASALFARYPDDWLAAPAWAQLLLTYATEGEAAAGELLDTARERNRHVEQYLSGRKRRPSRRAGMYSPGDEAEANYCAEMLLPAWRAPPSRTEMAQEHGRSRPVERRVRLTRHPPLAQRVRAFMSPRLRSRTGYGISRRRR